MLSVFEPMVIHDDFTSVWKMDLFQLSGNSCELLRMKDRNNGICLRKLTRKCYGTDKDYTYLVSTGTLQSSLRCHYSQSLVCSS